MNKKNLLFLIAAPALLLLFLFKILPVFLTVLLSLKEYSVIKGIFGSPSAGLAMYSALFRLDEFPRIWENTCRLGVFSLVLTTVSALILLLCISGMPGKVLKLISVVILAIPAFIPVTSFVWIFARIFSVNGLINNLLLSAGMEPILFFGVPAFYPFLFALMDSMRNVYVPVIIGLLVCEGGSRPGFGKIACIVLGYLAARSTILLSPDMETLLASYNPLVYSSADVFDTLSYRIGPMHPGAGQMQYPLSVASAAWVVKTIVQLAISILAFFILSKTTILSKITPVVIGSVDASGIQGGSGKRGAGIGAVARVLLFLLFAAGSVTMVLLTFLPTAGGLSDGLKLLLGSKGFAVSIANSLLYCVLGCILYGFMTLTLAIPMSAGRKLYPLLLVVVASLTNNILGEYLLMRKIGGINTLVPVVLGPGLAVIGAFALHFSATARLKTGFPGLGQYVKAALPPLAAIVALAFITSWGGYLHQYIYLIDKPDLYGVGLFGKQILLNQANANAIGDAAMQLRSENAKSAFVFLSSIIPAVLGSLLIFLNKHLPLTAFGAQIRKG